MNLLQINTVGNIGSTGRIAEQIGIEAIRNGWKSYIACARSNQSKSEIIRIGAKWHRYPNVLWTRIFDSDSPLSRIYTLKFINDIKKLSPDIIHLHNLHGYYLHVPTLLEFLGEYNRPVVWTLHDCWPFTGHCSHFDFCGCCRWKTLCYKCPQKMEYPASWVFDRSKKNYLEKRALISRIKNLILIPVSDWLCNIAISSGIYYSMIQVIRNGIDLSSFSMGSAASQTKFIPDKSRKMVLFVSNIWNYKKGFHLIPKLSEMLGSKFQCIVVGTNKKQTDYLKKFGISSIKRTENVGELANLYKMADVFVNTSLEESLPTVNMEAIACGTPVAAFDVGGTRETIPDNKIGLLSNRGDIANMKASIVDLAFSNRDKVRNMCISAAKIHFDARKAFKKYISLYSSILK